MASSFRFTAGLVVLASLADATVSSRLPRATATFNFPLDQFAPRPTKAPVYGDLRKRKSTDATVLVAPDNTCGYVSGRAGAEYTCGGSATCALMPPVNSNIPGRVACCGSQNCNAPRTCFDYKDVYTSSLCDSGCRVDTETRKCTETGLPYCRTVSFSDNIYGYWCASEENSTPQAVLTTYAGQRARQWSEVVVTLGDSTSSRAARPTASAADTTASDRETSASPSPGPDSDDNKSSSAPIGAIVGGAVGGVAVIALAVFGIWFLIRKKNHKGGPQGQQQQQQQPQMGYAQPPPSQYAATTNTQSFHDPKFGGPNGYPQSFGGTPPPPPPPQQDGYHQQPPYYAAAAAAGGFAVPDRTDTTSPGSVSQMTHSNTNNDLNNHYSAQQPISPSTTQGGGFQHFGQAAPPTTIHEAPTTADGHRGHMHELA
ncbi:hypothetical protein LY76DRAFT_646795 [Colletotrichum caudatum]|nr:hypothetical protein LY76DRAFT_646795 [Colletotrichum caudatum]